MTPEQEQLEAIRAEIASLSPHEQQVIELMACQLRDAVARQPLVLSAFALVAAEQLVLHPEDEA
jgi:hypothetical protein